MNLVLSLPRERDGNFHEAGRHRPPFVLSHASVALEANSLRGNQQARGSVRAHGAHSWCTFDGQAGWGKTGTLSIWLGRLLEHREINKALVSLGNKLVCIARVIIARDEQYHPHIARPFTT